MDIFDLLTLFGGLAMFLYGMRLMGDALKENSSGTLKRAMEQVTNNPVNAFVLGLLVTALIQSSTATIVITSGLVGAGILTLHQSLGIIVGANVGTTVTGQIIRLLDLDASGGVSWLRFLQPSTLAPVSLIIGMGLIMGGKMKNSRSIGNIAIGFGILFAGLLDMTGAVSELAGSGIVDRMFSSLGDNPLLGYITGVGVSFVLQSSSATIGILQAFSAADMLTFKGVYAIIVGVYLGDCVTTAIVCSIGAKPEAKRVGAVNILFNLGKTVLVLLGVVIAHKVGFLSELWDSTVNSGIIANTNTVFNLCSAVCLFPFLKIFEGLSRRIIKDEPEARGKYEDKLDALSPAFLNTPALSLRSCYDVLMAMFLASRKNIEKSFRLIQSFDETAQKEILADEDEVDRMTDRVSRYMVELLPRLRSVEHTRILDQYYKVCAEFERLGDHAVNIANLAGNMEKSGTSFSQSALYELSVLKKIIDRILDFTDTSFRRRDAEAAWQIEPLVQVAEEFISQLKKHHLKRMSSGECSLLADVGFSNLMVECTRIVDICSNIGVATMVRVRPELADHEHLYYESMHTGSDPTFNKAFERAYDFYFGQLTSNPAAVGQVPGDGGQDQEPC